jgi:trimeric autotransporter adhesin
MTPKKQVSPAIRILRGERDASARATHLEAATRKFLVSTNERKYMSTKTNFKRIALVAVAALGLGVLSSVPSQATVNTAAVITATNGTATVALSDSRTAATVAVRFFTDGTVSAQDTAVVTISMGTQPTGTSLATADIMVTALDTSLSSGGASVLKGKTNDTTAWATAGGLGLDSQTATTAKGIITKAAVGNAYGKFGFFLQPGLARVAGTYSFDYVVKIYSGDTLAPTLGGSGSVSIVVTDGTVAAAGAVSAAGQSKAVMKGGATWATSGDSTDIDSTVSVVNTPSSSTPSAVIRVTQLQADGTVSRESITVTTNIGNVGNESGTSIGKSITMVGDADGIQDIGVFADGTSGVATITIKTTSVTFTSKSVTFYSTSVDKYEVTVLGSVIGGAAANALLVKTYDASGNLIVDNTSAYAYSSNLDVIATGGTAAAATGTACTYSSSSGGQICALTGSANGTADITIRNKSTAALSTKASTAVKLTVNTLLPAKVSIAFDKATYAPGEVAYIRVVATDAAGAAVGPNATSTNLLSSAGITSSVAFGNGSETTTASEVNLRYTTASSNGYASNVAIGLYKVYMPASGGTVTITAKGGSALPAAGAVTVTATASVTDSGAAALAAVNALATTVASLRTLITTLTNLVLKIQKKVKA